MDYEKKYNEALKRAKEIKSKILSSHLSTESCKAVSEYINEIIPELAESEDERILNGLIAAIKDQISCGGEFYFGIPLKDILAYLEKQKEQNLIMAKSPQLKEQKPAEWSEEDEKMRINILNALTPQLVYSVGKGTYTGTSTYKYDDDEIRWLKSLPMRCPKSSDNWKPSEEQMEAFRSYIKDFQEKAEAAVGGWNNFDVMIRLFEQLKKLM